MSDQVRSGAFPSSRWADRAGTLISTIEMSVRSQPPVGILWVGFLTALVVLPWVPSGYIFGTDFAGDRIYRFPTSPASYSGLQLALALTGLVLPGEIVGKVLITSLLFTAGITAYLVVPTGGFVPRAVASLVYLFNPFVYDRLAYGQLNVLGGYAVLPWVASSIRWLLLEPNWKRALRAACAVAVLGVLDLHLTLAAVVIGAAFSLTHVVTRRAEWHYLARLGWNATLACILMFAASAYWILPILTGSGPESRRIGQIGQGDLNAFSTTADPSLGLLPNVLGLYGFWAERTGRFTSMKEFVPIWPAALVALVAVVAVGAIYIWRSQASFPGAQPWIAGLLLAAVAAIILDVGVAEPHVAGLITWLDRTFPMYRGMRDANKWAAVLALVYSQFAALGAIAIQRGLDRVHEANPFRTTSVSLVVALLLALPLYYGNGLLYGMHGQVQPSHYPAGWYSADRVLTQDPHPGETVFLPWHGYVGLSFVRNTNPVVMSPAPTFFSVPVIASQDLEVPGIPPPLDEPQATVGRLVTAGARGDWAATLAGLNVKYVLLAREVSWQSYSFLDSQPNLILVGDYGSIVLYRNLSWEQK